MVKLWPLVVCILATTFVATPCVGVNGDNNYSPSPLPSQAQAQVTFNHDYPPSPLPLTPSPSQEPAPFDCSMVMYDMVDCIPFLSNGSVQTEPDATCCWSFETVLKADPECICEALQSSDDMGLDLNITKALNIPSACGVFDPHLSCIASIAPGASQVNPPNSAVSPITPPTTSTPPASPAASTLPVTPSTTGGGAAKQSPASSLPSASRACYSTYPSFAALVVMLFASLSLVLKVA